MENPQQDWEAGGERLDPNTEIPLSWREDVAARGLRVRPPTHMTEGGYTGFSRWDSLGDSRVDRAVLRTRHASFPLFGLDPDDPRD